MKHSSKKLSQLITQLCIYRGIDNIVISPGSRNAPLTIGFSENKNFTCFSIVDERCAAFFALGMAQQHNKPISINFFFELFHFFEKELKSSVKV